MKRYLPFFMFLILLFLLHAVAKAGEIHTAAKRGNLEKVKSLLLKNPKLIDSREEEFGWTPLHAAVFGSRKKVVEFLIKKKANVNAKDVQNQWTPLHWAASGGKLELVKILVENGADVNIKGKYKKTPVFLTIKFGKSPYWYDKVALYLCSKKAKLNIRDKDGFTPLLIAALAQSVEMSEIFLKNGANINVKDANGRTPLSLATDDKNEKLIKLYKKYGAKK